MASLFDWSPTAASNSTIDGINCATGMPVGNTDNLFRSMVAIIRQSFSSTLQSFLAGSAALPVASGGTGATTAADARTALGLGSAATESTVPVAKGGTGATDAATARTNLGVAAAPSVSGSAGTGKIALGGGFVLTWRDHTVGSGSTSCAYGDGHTYSSWARAWVEGDNGSGDVSVTVSSQTTSAATVRAEAALSFRLFSIGV